MAAPVFDAVSSGETGGANSLTIPHTCTGTDRGLVYDVSRYAPAGQTIAGVTYAGVAMTQFGTDIGNGAVSGIVNRWVLSNPASGTNNVVITASGSIAMCAGGVSYTNAHQTTASLCSTFTSGTGSSNALSLNVASSSDQIVQDGFSLFAAVETVGAGQTQRWNINNADEYGGGSTEAGSATTTMSWSLDASADWAHIASNVNAPAGAAGIAIPVVLKQFRSRW